MLKKLSKLSLIFLGVFVCLCTNSRALAQQDTPGKQCYIAGTVPDSLKDNANSIVRYYSKNIVVKGPGKNVIKVHKIVTILNEKGDREAVFVLGYNKKYDNYSSIEMRAYDAQGTLLKKYHKADMYDGSATDGFSIVTDERFLGVKHTISSYPQTIETEYEEDVTSSINLDEWEVQKDQQSVEYESCEITVDTSAGFRYHDKNTFVKPTKVLQGGSYQYRWEIKNLKAIKLEERAEEWRVLPSIEFSVKNFQFYGVAGDFASWQDFGKWIWGLNSQVNSLSPERAAEIKKMTDTIKTDKDKARFLYSYLQQNTRYVSIQLGIGGFQPFAASFVDQKKYGDCKALANYMYALLKAVNIDSYCAVINAEANQEPADPSFPFNDFNHEILCIPFKGDTTWLDCTMTYAPFGKLGSFTENRRALLITENGGKLVNTPKSTMDDNVFDSRAHIILDADGGAKADVKIFSTGVYRDECINFSARKVDEQKEAFMDRLNIKQPNVFEIRQGKDIGGVKETDFSLEYDKFCDIKAGDKQFYRPHVIDLVAFTVPVEEHRKSDYYFETPIKKSYITTIDLPPGFEVETLPVNQNLKFSYGNYEVKYTYDVTKNQVISTAQFNLTKQVIPAAKYNELQEYLDAISKAQNKKLVIRRKA
jgi:hypothetical protein